MKNYFISALLLSAAGNVMADEVINENLVVTQKTCIGVDCQDGEQFSFETLKVKGDSPQIYFKDTSNSGAFPRNDWQVGVSDEVAGNAASFFIEDTTHSRRVLEISPEGDVALGSMSVVVEDAISVGSESAQRRVTFVADAESDTDAVNLRTAQDMVSNLDVAAEAAELDAALDELNTRLSALSARVSALEP